ncbi:MFS transporter [Nonomuraea sp. NPDC049684]|uniref:MFS transporter n=1 Tax=Nonomuraea sp. NPDC049684 TaxID=3364356 RepID=UPI0037884B52
MFVPKLYVYTFLGEFVLLYPVYTLLFTDSGLSVAETSSLFVIWSVTGMVLEVPSGAWADAVSRRLLLFLGPLLAGAGFALWVLFPSYWAFALGFVLWGAEGALVSGAFEALAYEELERRGLQSRYAAIMGRAHSIGIAAAASAIALATPVFAVGGYPAVGVASVAACLLCAATALTLPERRPGVIGSSTESSTESSDESSGDSGGRYLAVLRAGVAEARTDRNVLEAIVLISVVTAIWGALEEYVPFLAAETGAPRTAVPLLVLAVWVGAAAGGLLAGPARRLSERSFALVLALAALAMAAGALVPHPAGFLLVAGSFGAFQMAGVVADTRLQERVSGGQRATVTSMAGLGTNVVTLAVYTAYGAGSPFLSHGTTFALLVLPYVVIALWLARERVAPM